MCNIPNLRLEVLVMILFFEIRVREQYTIPSKT